MKGHSKIKTTEKSMSHDRDWNKSEDREPEKNDPKNDQILALENQNRILEEQVATAKTKLEAMTKDRNDLADKYPRLELMLNALSQQCDFLAGKLRETEEDKANMLAESSKALSR